jgi:hypothetical protein
MLHRLQHVATQWYAVAISEWTPEEQRALGDVLARFRHDLQRLEFDGTGRAVALSPTEAPIHDQPQPNQEVCA